LAAALLYALIALAFVSPGLLPGKTLSNSDALWFEPPWVGVKPAGLERPSNPELGDAPRHIQPFLREVADAVPDVPLWNPNIQAGRPFQANSQSAVFSLYNLPAYVLPFWTALGWIGALKLWVASFGTFLLARALGVGFAGALLAGLVFALNLKMVTWLSYPAMSVWTFIPWLLLATDRLLRRPDALTIGALASVVAVQFLAGHAESSFQALLAAVAFLAFRLWQARRSARPARVRLAPPLLAFGAGVAGGAAIAAVSLVPFAELLWLSADRPDRRGASIDLHFPARDALGLFLPDYWGRPTQTPIRPLLLERAMYVGALPLMLAGAAVILRPNPDRIAVALFGAFWFAVVFGVPPFTQVVTRLPIFSSGHNTRLIVLVLLALALLAGWGLDELVAARRASARRRRTTLALAGALLLLPVAVVIAAGGVGWAAIGDALRVAWLLADAPTRVTNPDHEAVIRLSSLAIWVAVAGAGLVLLALRMRRRLGAAAFAVLALVVVCIDLFRAGMGYNPAIDRDRATVPSTGAIDVLRGRGHARFVSTAEIPQNVIPLRYELYEARGYDLPIVRRFDRLWRQEVSPESPSVARGLFDIPLELREVTPRALRTLRLLGVTHILRGTTGRAADPPYEPTSDYPPLGAPRLTEVYAGADARVYRLEGALPRAWVVPAQQIVDDESAALAAVTRPEFDPRGVAVTERRLPGLPALPAGAESGRPGPARIVRYEDEHVVVQARSDGPGLLVLGDTWFPGWKAEVDGRDASVEPVDYVLRGVRLGPGEHTISFRYAPASWTGGRVLSGIALVGLLVTLAAGRRARRRPATGRRLVGSGA
jgi:hypothetical protein